MTETADEEPFTENHFRTPDKQCDLVMKGGVTSGVVYPYAILELARVYRFRSIGGTSAGAIAAAFAAAAEYARQHGDPAGFVRMEQHCKRLPTILASLFQPAPRFRGLMTFLMKAQAGHLLTGLLAGFPLTVVASLAFAFSLFVLPGGGWIAGVLGVLVLAPALIFGRVFSQLWFGVPKHGFGLCPGLTQPHHRSPGLTDWIYNSLQDIAFGAGAATAAPLTFGDLAGSDFDHPDIDLRMVTTNLSMGRPHALPRLDWPVSYEPTRWAKLFPATVMAHMATTTPAQSGATTLAIPDPKDLPVIVAVRMSLSFPFLFQAIPVTINDIESANVVAFTGGPKTVTAKTAWFSDGGISSNFPIHFFDALLPTRPTFALSLDDLPAGAIDGATDKVTGEPLRVMFPQGAASGAGAPLSEIKGLGGFAMSLFGAAANWRDQLLAAMPGQRERIARVYLDARQGGLNLSMPPARSKALMGYGRQVGRGFAGGKLDFDEHRWRRTLIAYAQLEMNIAALDTVWNQKGYASWFSGYSPKTYKENKKPIRDQIGARITSLAALAPTFKPPIYKPRTFPNPMGKLRINPDV